MFVAGDRQAHIQLAPGDAAAVRSTCPSGTTMLRMKYRPDITVKARITAAITTLTAMAFLICAPTRVRLVTRRIAATSSAA